MSNRSRLLCSIVPLLLGLLSSNALHAQWIEGGSIPICTAPGNQTNFCSTSDGRGGVIVAWQDCRNGCWEIYAQRLDSSGYARWGVNGVLAAGPSANIGRIVMVGDGEGGAVLAWIDVTQDVSGSASLNVYAQKIDASGNLSAGLTGIPLSLAKNSQDQPVIASDGSGGAIVAWNDHRRWDPAHPHYEAVDIYAQRIDHAGGTPWSSNGRLLLMGDREAFVKALFPDGSGGVILSYANGAFGLYESGITRIDHTLNAVWNVFPTEAEIVISDGERGVIGVWNSADSTRGQRIDSQGVLHWGAGGKTILPGIVSQWAVPDARGGLILMWDTYVQRVDMDGNQAWTPCGVNVQVSYPIIEDGFGGVIVGSTAVQRIDSSGVVLWRPGGEPTVAGSSAQLVSDGAGGAILIFGSGDNIYAQRVNPGDHAPVLAPIGDRSTDVGDTLGIQLSATDADTADVLTFSTNAAAALPSAFSFDEGTGLFSWTPVSGDAGDYAVTFSATDGLYADRETVVISVFEHGTRPPVIEPIGDVTVLANMPVVIEAHASDPDGDALTYSILDARFTQSDSVFSWQTTSADTGTYHFIVSVTDGIFSDSATVTVRVLKAPPFNAYHDPMTGLPGSPFEWAENAVVWHAEEAGYLSGAASGSWSQAVVSTRALNAWADSQVVFRMQFIPGATNYIVGFTGTPPSSTDFHYARVNLGLYLHSGGTLRPSWSVNTSPWAFTVASGVVDVRVTLRKGRQTVAFDLENVSSFEDPQSTFSAPDWSAEMARPVGDTYYVQINPYSTAAKVYDVWLGSPGCGPVLQPIDDAVVWENGWTDVIIEAHATCGCGCVPRYWMNDPRFVQCADGIFCWTVEEGDAGEYHPVVYVTDGESVDSVAVNVTVLRHWRLLRGYFAFMAAATDGPFAWHEKDVVWYPQEKGYLSGMAPPSWHSGVVSGASFATSPKRSVIVRFLRSCDTNIKAGFTFTPPRENDLDSRKIDCGVYIDSTGSIRPTGPADNPGVWKTGLHEGVYDLRIDVDRSTSTVTRSLVRVPGFDDPSPDFSTVVWSVQETASIPDSCWIQINPYNSVAKIYSVWSIPLVRVDVLSSSAVMDKHAVRVTWTLSERSSEVQFFVSREENGDGVFDELPGITIEKDSLTYAFADSTCEPNTAYRYMVEANYPTGRTLLFYQSIKTPSVTLALLQNHPNPFAWRTTIAYDVPEESRVTIDVYNVLGQHVARLVNAKKSGGRHTIVWDGNDDSGRPVSSGIYFYRMEWGPQTLSRKMILLR